MPISEATKQLLAAHWNNHNEIIKAWKAAESQLDDWRIRERALRMAVFELKFENAKEGVNRFELGNGYTLKADYKFNYNLKNKNEETWQALEAITKVGNEGTFIAERLVKWKPELSISEYRKLEGEYKKLIDTVLEIKPGLPSLELEEPKK